MLCAGSISKDFGEGHHTKMEICGCAKWQMLAYSSKDYLLGIWCSGSKTTLEISFFEQLQHHHHLHVYQRVLSSMHINCSTAQLFPLLWLCHVRSRHSGGRIDPWWLLLWEILFCSCQRLPSQGWELWWQLVQIHWQFPKHLGLLFQIDRSQEC